jgi:hypothetical protein
MYCSFPTIADTTLTTDDAKQSTTLIPFWNKVKSIIPNKNLALKKVYQI